MVRALVIDDEKPSREVLCNYLRDYCTEVQVVSTASSVKTGYKAIQKHNPDVVFLDIEMPDGQGFDLLSKFETIDFKVIFVTAYSEYAIKAFRVNAIDYLLKPVKIEELKDAIAKVNSGNAAGNDLPLKITEVMKQMKEMTRLQSTIIVPNIKGFEVLKIEEIIMCKADGYCTNFYLTGNRKMVSSKNLKQYETILAEYNFLRVHNSFLINMNHVSSFTRQGEIILTENNKAFLGDSFRHLFHNKFIKK